MKSKVDKKRSQMASIINRFSKNKLAMCGFFIFLFVVLMGLSALIFVDYENDVIKQNISNRLQRPTGEHIFGTDMYGRDVFSRILYGTCYSLGISGSVMIIGLVGGVLCGAIAGYLGGKIDGFIMRIMDVFLALPATLLAIAVVATLGQSVENIILALSISKIPQFARIVRSVVLPIRNQEYIEAAKSAGSGNGYILLRHILPNAVGSIIVQATLDVSFVILSIAGLGFLGLGVPPPAPEWGGMLSEVRQYLRGNAYLAVVPGVTICICAMSLNLIGDGLRDALDPKMKN